MANPIFLQQLRQFNDPLTDNDLLLVKVKRRVNMPADEDMGVRYSKFIDQLQLGRFVQKAGDIMSGDLVFVNNRGIFGTTTSGATKSIFKLDNSDTVVVGSVTQTLKLATKDLIKANVNGTERVVYHSGNSNLATVDWRAKNIIADQTLWVNGESTFGDIAVRKLSAIYGYDAGNLKVRMIGIDADDDVAVGVTTKRFGILVKDPNEIWAVQEEGNPAKQWRVLTTGNFTSHLNGTYVLKTQTVNGKPLAGNITLTAADVGALAATGKVVASSYGDALTLQGIAAGLTFQESDTSKQYHVICDGETFRINEDNSGGKSVLKYEKIGASGRQLTTDSCLRLAGVYSQYTGQANWQIPIAAASNVAITSLTKPSGADQYAGIGVHDNGGLYGWNHLSAKGYAFEISTEEAQFHRQIFENGQRVYSPNNKPTNADVGLGNVPNLIHTSDPTAGTVAVRDASGDIHARLFKSNYPNDDSYTELGALAFRVNPTDGFTRFTSDKAKINAWLGTLSRDIVNINASGNWADIINKIPKVTAAGAIELGKYIDLRDTNSNNDFDVRLAAIGATGSQCLNIQTVNGYIDVGAKNASYAHIYTDRPAFAFNAGALFLGNIAMEGNNFIFKAEGRRHFAFQRGDALVDGYFYKDVNGSFVWNHGVNTNANMWFGSDGVFFLDGARWAAAYRHAYDGQAGINAPITVNYGAVGGGSDYYPCVRAITQASGYGYTTQVDFGTLRSGNGAWGQGIIRVASHESAHPSAVYSFSIDGDFYSPRNGNFNDVYIRSDETLKKNVVDLSTDSSLKGILQLRTVEYDKRIVDREEYDIHEEGLIAQEVEKIFPSVVGVDENTGLKSIKLYPLVTHLIGALQKQQEMINRLQELVNNVN